MADDFVKMQNKQMDIGGKHCPCCNWFFGKSKRLCNKGARAKLKEQDRRHIYKILRKECPIGE